MRIQKDNKAVSPVIGIMLMLVVTVILAAAVSSSSSGLMKSTEKAPFAVFDVKVAKSAPNEGYFFIKEISGDTINTKDIKIVTINPKAAGSGKVRDKLPSEKVNYTYSSGIGIADIEVTNSNAPYWNNGAKGYFGKGDVPDIYFGNYILKPGVSMASQQFTSKYYYNGTETDEAAQNADSLNWVNLPFNYPTWDPTANWGAGDYTDDYPIGQMQDLFADWGNISKGDLVTVKLVHLPSNKVIFSSDVEVI